ncbi:Type I site-specific restriction-modification system R (restriction) subunit [Methanonatronarchaeum thermophilum]|uniref:type I site-specific deoxyribonuclease n=1 Tax=Methanonatronarchaeum thermophilum TaxID=1927129 RepID=A0A1Y3G9B0_9EURY|nr:type I restriction endonuclease subunit R [Methanonatronarchaeum thermophilum]OUJ18041.1 Type I site-specific restriction-modification system R (restriction) subunit [Methanonatronarchaeum thermophilum]
MSSGNEYNYVEGPALDVFESLGYEVFDANLVDEFPDNRKKLSDVVLRNRLRGAIERINPWISENNLNKAVKEIVNVDGVTSMRINKKVHGKLVKHNVSLKQDRGRGKKHQTVKYVDFEDPEKNEFLVLSQFEVAGLNETIKPDIVVFLNGIPVGVIECKSPTITDPKKKAIDQLLRYQNNRNGIKEGAEKLFYYNQLSVASWGDKSIYGTYQTPKSEYTEWKVHEDKTKEKIKNELGKENLKSQDILLYSLFEKKRFLDFLRNFTVFRDKGQDLVKMVARYQQYRAVKKALNRIKKRNKSDKQGGVVWHTQGSGKSLSMLFLSLKLRRIKDDPTILLVTDRQALDRQIKSTFEQCGFPNPKRAKSIEDLRRKLKNNTGQTITTLVHKFQEKDEEERFPVLSGDKDIYVMVDEAHRTQYKLLANNMREALPNAFYIGFTGTPIEKNKRNTRRTFGNYIDTYTIDQSIEDGVTLEIFYQGRLADLHLDGVDLDKVFNRVFQDKTEEEKKEIRKRYAQQQDLSEAPRRIDNIVLDILDHFEQKISDPFKGMIVTTSRRAAVTYKEKMDKYNGPESAVVISGDHNDSQKLKKYTPTDEGKERIKDRFKDSSSDLKFLIVCDMLLTGFDAPIAQVMYLDKPLKEHNLLQAIARVNRPFEDKNYGLIIDYYGVSDNLKEALYKFSEEDIKRCMTGLEDEEVVSRLEAAHRKSKSFFKGKKIDNSEGCVEELEDEQRRIEFNKAYKNFSKMMDILLPSKKATPYLKDLEKLGEIYTRAKNRYRDDSMNLEGAGEKVRGIIKEHITTKGIETINEEPVSITDGEEFENKIEELKNNKSKLKEMEHALRYETNVRFDEDPVFYKSLQKKIERLIEIYKKRRLEEKKVIKEFKSMIKAIRTREQEAKKKGLSDSTELAIYNTLDESLSIDQKELKEISKEITKKIEEEKTVDWKKKVSVQKDMRKGLKLYLYQKPEVNLNKDEMNHLINKIIKLARTHY